jgi:hypothetical protein
MNKEDIRSEWCKKAQYSNLNGIVRSDLAVINYIEFLEQTVIHNISYSNCADEHLFIKCENKVLGNICIKNGASNMILCPYPDFIEENYEKNNIRNISEILFWIDYDNVFYIFDSVQKREEFGKTLGVCHRSQLCQDGKLYFTTKTIYNSGMLKKYEIIRGDY